MIWFITGTSTGLGREWATAALERGDQVAATARDITQLEPLAKRFGTNILPLQLDVTDREAVFKAVATADKHFNGLDVVVSNAGYGHVGMVEELTERELREQLEPNFFGAVWTIQAALPIMRKQQRGHLIQVTSEGGVRAFPTFGAYHASKWALEGLAEALWQEVEQFGIHVTNVEPGPYATDFATRSLHESTHNNEYRREEHTWEVGDPKATSEALFELVDSKNPPHRLFMGRSFEAVEKLYEERLETWREWQETSLKAFG